MSCTSSCLYVLCYILRVLSTVEIQIGRVILFVPLTKASWWCVAGWMHTSKMLLSLLPVLFCSAEQFTTLHMM